MASKVSERGGWKAFDKIQCFTTFLGWSKLWSASMNCIFTHSLRDWQTNKLFFMDHCPTLNFSSWRDSFETSCDWLGASWDMLGTSWDRLGIPWVKMEQLWDLYLKFKTVIYKSKQIVSVWHYRPKGIGPLILCSILIPSVNPFWDKASCTTSVKSHHSIIYLWL